MRMDYVAVAGAPSAFVAELASQLQLVLGPASRVEALAEGSGGPDTATYNLVYAPGPRGFEPVDLAQAGACLNALEQHPPQHLVVISSSAAYPASPRHPGLAAEDYRPGGRESNSISSYWRALEELALKQTATIPSVTVIRPANLVSTQRNDYLNRLLRSSIAVVPPGFDPPFQCTSLSDLAGALRAILGHSGTGFRLFNLAPAGVMPLSQAFKQSGCLRIPIPQSVQKPLRWALSWAGVAAPSQQIEYLKHSSTLSGTRLKKQLGFRPRYSSTQALQQARGIEAGEAGPKFDDFGMDKEAIESLGQGLFRFLHDRYWRIETRGLSHIPRSGPALLVGIHRGVMPLDGIMMLHACARWRRRHPRFLVHPGLLKAPFSSRWIMKLGGIPAWRRNAERVLSHGGLLGVFPEGVSGAFTPIHKAYQLLPINLDFVRLALQFRVPIVPFVSVGPAETYPILATIRWKWWRRQTLWPCFPIIPTLPWIPLPLPTKWHTWVLPPYPVAGWPAGSERDPEAVRRVGQEIRGQMEEALDWILIRRKSWFWGSVFSADDS